MMGIVSWAFQRGAQFVGVISAVGDHPLHPDSVFNEQVGAPDVGGVARRQDEAERPADDIHERMDLGRTTAPRDADEPDPVPWTLG
jgi:hypothetical protein